MINQQLLEYIKQQSAQGVSKEDIKKVLLDNGWQENDIDETFAAATSNSGASLPPQAPNTASRLPDIGVLLKETWELYKKRVGTFLLISLIPSLISSFWALFSAGYFAVSRDNINITLLTGILIIIAAIAVIFFWFWSQVALLFAIKDSEENIGFKESFRRGWHKIGSYLWISILSALVVIGGYLLLIVPGIIFAIWFSLAAFVLVTENIKGMDALLKSREYIKGRWGGVFWRFIGFGLIVSLILAALAIVLYLLKLQTVNNFFNPIIALFLAPFATAYAFLVYRHLKAEKGDFVFQPQKKGLFIFIAILGFVIPTLIGVIGGVLSLIKKFSPV